ncbi:MAG TPA: GC-type dockerin domain-anchored protein [Phycisphaerales bacterium]|nr:GC-type dockerin domain-anchored protein [Phycisphaerales bacterium]
MPCKSPLALVLACGLCAGAAAQTVTVDTARDIVDFGGAQTIDDLPGPDGRVSFREALMATDNTPGPQTVAFAVPRDEWWYSDVKAMLENDGGSFVVEGDETTIDFLTQVDFTGDTNADGREVGIKGTFPNGMGAPALSIYGDHCVVRGMAEVEWRRESVAISGNHNRVVGCVTGIVAIDPYPEHCGFNTIGGVAPEDRNELDTVEIVCGADDNVVIGNKIEQIFVGASPYCDTSSRNRIGGPTPEERNVINGFGHYGEEGFPVGEGIEVSWATDTLIEGNYIGVDETGTQRVVQIGPIGIEVGDSVRTVVRNNLVAGLWVRGRNHYQGQTFGEAIRVTTISVDQHDTVIEGNLIGTDYTGEHPILTLNGVIVDQFTARQTPHGTRIGGAEPGQGNLIAFCERKGIGVASLIEDAEISGNAIHSNGQLGIDLATWSMGYDGITPNDADDADTEGANGLQNFPVLASADSDGRSTAVTGSLNSRPGREYRIEFFENVACDPSGFGEGERFLGSTLVTTDGAGDATFEAVLPAGAAVGSFITATATDTAAGATSEFSACIAVVGAGGCTADFNGDGLADTRDVLAFLNAWNSDDAGSDINNDGAIDTRDVLAFLNLWTAGC